MKRVLDAGIFIALLAAVTQTVAARGNSSLPDTASTSVLMGIACLGLAAIRRFKR